MSAFGRVSTISSGGVVNAQHRCCRIDGQSRMDLVFEHRPVKVQLIDCKDTRVVLRQGFIATVEAIRCERCKVAVKGGASSGTITVEGSSMCVVELAAPAGFKVFSIGSVGLTLVEDNMPYSVPQSSMLAVSVFEATLGWQTSLCNNYGDAIHKNTAGPIDLGVLGEIVEDEDDRRIVRTDDDDEGLGRQLFSIVKRHSGRPILPCEISSDLLLSDAQGVSDPKQLRSLGVTHVLNMAEGETRRIDYECEGINYLGIDALDAPGYNVMRHFEVARDFYLKARQKGCLVVHCVAGINRSGAIATALYVWATGTPLLDAAAHVNSRRSSYLWNSSFRKFLLEWEKDIRG
ncbi:hypothetical protein CTAYLR_002458 [Chrysophaeum taylorii]|uniref:protein-tyrosine-phosphatase n=1 Tax=Chrysophaeum taylorii TaxID=2483200 RepID=A0AAD7XTJ1_9STRA|nr:hypothetical protein CTAYLR_002458 [Chrysophaeum taylorii]